MFLYLYLGCTLSQSGSQRKVSCLKLGSEMNGFCLYQGQGLKALAALPPKLPLGAPPLPEGREEGGGAGLASRHIVHQI